MLTTRARGGPPAPAARTFPEQCAHGPRTPVRQSAAHAESIHRRRTDRHRTDRDRNPARPGTPHGATALPDARTARPAAPDRTLVRPARLARPRRLGRAAGRTRGGRPRLGRRLRGQLLAARHRRPDRRRPAPGAQQRCGGRERADRDQRLPRVAGSTTGTPSRRPSAASAGCRTSSPSPTRSAPPARSPRAAPPASSPSTSPPTRPASATPTWPGSTVPSGRCAPTVSPSSTARRSGSWPRPRPPTGRPRRSASRSPSWCC